MAYETASQTAPAASHQRLLCGALVILSAQVVATCQTHCWEPPVTEAQTIMGYRVETLTLLSNVYMAKNKGDI